MTFSFYTILTFSAFLLSLLGTRATIISLRKREAPINHPTLRESYNRQIPRSGGIAVVMVLIICLLVADIPYGIVLSMFMLAAVSLLDDLIGVPLIVRLLVQVLAVLIPLSVMTDTVFGGLLPLWADRAATALLWLWFINLFHFMDGVDGISPTEMICIGMGFCMITIMNEVFSNPLSTYSLVIVAAAWGFLWWNWYPAKINLGEVGSVPIGFLMGYILLLAATTGYHYAAFILPAYYISDGGITMLRRICQRKSFWGRHNDYYYQKAIRNGRRHDTVTRYVFGINLLLVLLANFSVLDPDFAMLYTGLAYMAVFMILGFFAYTSHNPQYEPF